MVTLKFHAIPLFLLKILEDLRFIWTLNFSGELVTSFSPE